MKLLAYTFCSFDTLYCLDGMAHTKNVETMIDAKYQLESCALVVYFACCLVPILIDLANDAFRNFRARNLQRKPR